MSKLAELKRKMLQQQQTKEVQTKEVHTKEGKETMQSNLAEEQTEEQSEEQTTTTIPSVEFEASFHFKNCAGESAAKEKLDALAESVAEGKGLLFAQDGTITEFELSEPRTLVINIDEEGKSKRETEEYTFFAPDMSVVVGEQFGDQSANVAKFLQKIIEKEIAALGRPKVDSGEIPTPETVNFDIALKLWIENSTPKGPKASGVNKQLLAAGCQCLANFLSTTNMKPQGQEMICKMAAKRFSPVVTAKLDKNALEQILDIIGLFDEWYQAKDELDAKNDKEGKHIRGKYNPVIELWATKLDEAINPVQDAPEDIFAI